MIARAAAAFLFAVSIASLSTAAQALTAEEVNAATWRPLEGPPSKKPDPMIVKAQALLDLRGHSPGVIDGYDGDNFRKAVSIFRKLNGLGEGDALDEPTWQALGGDAQTESIVNYTVTAEDAAYAFAPRIPADYAEQAKMKRLNYVNAQEMLAERFHMDTDLLAALQPRRRAGPGRRQRQSACGAAPGAAAGHAPRRRQEQGAADRLWRG